MGVRVVLVGHVACAVRNLLEARAHLFEQLSFARDQLAVSGRRLLTVLVSVLNQFLV